MSDKIRDEEAITGIQETKPQQAEQKGGVRL